MVQVTKRTGANQRCTALGGLFSLSRLRFCQPTSAQFFFRNIRQVGFDVKDGCAIEHVNASDPQPPSFAPEQLNYGQRNRVRSPRRTCGE